MTVVTQNLGPVKAIEVGANPPANIKMLWHDTNFNLPKYYNTNVNQWVSLVTSVPVDGSGTLNYIAKWTPDGDSLGNSMIFDDGTSIGLGTATPDSTALVDIGNVLRIRPDGVINVEINISNPTPVNGDIWITDGGGFSYLNVRIAGVTKQVELNG